MLFSKSLSRRWLPRWMRRRLRLSGVSITSSSAIEKSSMVSFFDESTKMSAPSPPIRVSLPLPPKRVSLPLPPLSRSCLRSPLRMSSPEEPWRVSCPWLPERESSPVLPTLFYGLIGCLPWLICLWKGLHLRFSPSFEGCGILAGSA